MARPTQTVQATGKIWKMLSILCGGLILALLLVFAGALVATYILGRVPQWSIAGQQWNALVVITAGLLVAVVFKGAARFGAWWFHG